MPDEIYQQLIFPPIPDGLTIDTNDGQVSVIPSESLTLYLQRLEEMIDNLRLGPQYISGKLVSPGSVLSGDVAAGDIVATNLTINFTQDFKFIERANITSLGIQGQTPGAAFPFELFTHDGDGTDSLSLGMYAKGTPTNTTNSEYLRIGYVGNVIPYNFFISSSAAGSGTVRPLHISTGANLTQFILGTNGNNSMSGTLTVGVLDASSGQVLVEDLATSEPSMKSDGYIGVAKIGSKYRIYFQVEGAMRYIDGEIAGVSPSIGNSMGAWLPFYYTYAA